MRGQIPLVLYAVAAVEAAAIHRPRQDNNSTNTPYTLPNSNVDIAQRASEIEIKRAGWVYGPSVAGNTSFYPSGDLGAAAAQRDLDHLSQFENPYSVKIDGDAALAGAAIVAAGGLTSLDNYAKLYDGQWKNSVPKGLYPGMLTNYTNDLLFSMERLTINPYAIARLGKDAKLPFPVDNAEDITGKKLDSLRSDGRLFYVDHSNQANQPKAPLKYAGASQASFYIHPESEDLLPLAIKTNSEGSDLIYTPKDELNDWLLAKLIFNSNDVWHGAFYHLAQTHDTTEIVYQAAIRTLSEEHPVLAVLHRLMKDAFSIRPFARDHLINVGGPLDQLFPWVASEDSAFIDSFYTSGEASAFQTNYFDKNLEKRGLINSSYGPKLKSFPFYEDASSIHKEIRTFIRTMIESYYTSPDMVEKDTEIQNWVKEAEPAKVIDFPKEIKTIESLIDVVTHMAHLVSIAHGTLNTNTPVASSASLPFHPAAFWAPLPTKKGIKDIMPFMPQIEPAVGQIVLLAAFNRPQFVNSDLTISHMFDDANMLARMTKETQEAAMNFKDKMNAFSDKVRARKFDEKGLCQGMPFIWTSLDPNTASYWLTI